MPPDRSQPELKEVWWAEIVRDLEEFPELNWRIYDAARERQDTLTKPQGALGRLEDFACWLAGWQGREEPRLDKARMVVFAGNHGVTAQGVSPFPSSVTAQMVENFSGGGAAICQLCEAYDADLNVVSLSLDQPTADITQAPAMSIDECRTALMKGAEAVKGDSDILLLGEMGIGNTTVAAALCHAMLGSEASDWAGPGTGLDAPGVARKNG